MLNLKAYRISIKNFKDKLRKMCWVAKRKELLVYFLEFLHNKQLQLNLNVWLNTSQFITVFGDS